MFHRLFSNRFFRRLFFVFFFLMILDPFIPSIVKSLEKKSYDTQHVTRFEESDLFSLGPTTEFLKDNPVADRKRFVFMGHSMTWGYWIDRESALPNRFQALVPQAYVYNLAFNGHRVADSYLIAKQIIGSVDSIFLLNPAEEKLCLVEKDGKKHYFGEDTCRKDFPNVPIDKSQAKKNIYKALPVTDEEAVRFNISYGDIKVERDLKEILRFWNLYKYSYRLQAGIWNTSTVLYFYTHKRDIIRSVRNFIFRRQDAAAPEAAPHRDAAPLNSLNASLVYNRSPSPMCEKLRKAALVRFNRDSPLLTDLALLAYKSRKNLFLFDLEDTRLIFSEQDRSLFNCIFFPYVFLIKTPVPKPEFTVDGRHFNARGTTLYSHALYEMVKRLKGAL